MTSLARKLRGVLTLRSGGADGADSFFEAGAGEDKEIYLPWRDFNGNPSLLYGVCSRAESLARKYHPAPHRLNGGVLRLMARNSYQVLGRNLDDPVEFVICWTPGFHSSLLAGPMQIGIFPGWTWMAPTA